MMLWAKVEINNAPIGLVPWQFNILYWLEVIFRKNTSLHNVGKSFSKPFICGIHISISE